MNWNQYYQNHYLLPKIAKVSTEPKTFGTADLKHISYDVSAAGVTNWTFYLNRIIHIMPGTEVDE